MPTKKRSLGDLECPECGSKCKRTILMVKGISVKGWQCTDCQYELIDPEEIEIAYHFLQAMKKEEVTISKRGNSFMVTIPKTIVDAIDIKDHSLARIYLKDEKTIEIEV